MGLFLLQTWLDLMRDAGFTAATRPYPVHDDKGIRACWSAFWRGSPGGDADERIRMPAVPAVVFAAVLLVCCHQGSPACQRVHASVGAGSMM